MTVVHFMVLLGRIQDVTYTYDAHTIRNGALQPRQRKPRTAR